MAGHDEGTHWDTMAGHDGRTRWQDTMKGQEAAPKKDVVRDWCVLLRLYGHDQNPAFSRSGPSSPRDPEGKPAADDLLPRFRLRALPTAPGRAVPEAVGRDLGLLPASQPRSPHRGTDRRGEPRTRCRGGPPTLHNDHQPEGGLDRLPLAGAVRLLCDGRAPSVCRDTLCPDESCARRPGRPRS